MNTSVAICLPSSSVIHQDLPHGPGGDRQKVGPVGCRHAAAGELEIGLVHQGRGLERQVGLLPGHLGDGELSQLLIDQRQQLFGRLRILRRTRIEDARHFIHGLANITRLKEDLPVGNGGASKLVVLG